MPTDSRRTVHGYPISTRTPFGLKATMVFRANWADALFIRDLMIMSNNNNGEQFPYSPIPCYCKEVSIVGDGKSLEVAGLMTYPECVITAQYESPDASKHTQDPSKPDEQISEILEPTIEFLTLDPAQFRWKTLVNANPTGKISKEAAPGVQVHGFNYTYTRHNITTLHPDVVALAGSINAQPIAMRLYPLTFPAETALYLPPQIGLSYMSDGARKFKAEMRFSIRNIPSWNRFFRPELYDPNDYNAAFDAIVRRDNGVEIRNYRVKPFTNLFPS